MCVCFFVHAYGYKRLEVNHGSYPKECHTLPLRHIFSLARLNQARLAGN